MSLLYECINGIIQGGILEGAEGTAEGEEIARLCVGKLRSMLVVEGDPNRMSSIPSGGVSLANNSQSNTSLSWLSKRSLSHIHISCPCTKT